MIFPDSFSVMTLDTLSRVGASARELAVRWGEIHGRGLILRSGLIWLSHAALMSGRPSTSGTTAISRIASLWRSWLPVPSRSRATSGAVVHGWSCMRCSRSVVFFACGCRQPAAGTFERFPLGWCQLIALQGAAMRGVHMRVVNLPELEPERVLEGVAALFAELGGQDVPILDQERRGRVEPDRVERDADLLVGGRDERRGATGHLLGRADVAQLRHAEVAVVVGELPAVGDAARR